MKAGTAQSGRTILAVFAAISLLLSLMAVYAVPADADHETPELIEETENQTCEDLEGDGQSWIELKQDEEELGDPTLSDGTLTVEIDNFDGKSFDWSSNIGVDAVFVKAGAAGSYLYRYDPPSEETSDTGLTTPGAGDSNAISHITFCYDVETKIIVEKVVADGDKELAFTFDTGGFALQDNTLSHNQSSSSGDLIPGEYSVTEQVPAGWTLDSVVCTNQDEVAENNEAIDLTSGEVVTCVFTNSEDPEPGEIIVEKEVTEGSDTTQSFDFTADYDTDGFSLADGGSNNSGDLDAGTYAVSETVPTGWTLESATCDNGDTPDSIDLGEGETVTCTFLNDETPTPEVGQIIVVKQVPLGDTTQEFDFNASYDGDGFSLAHGESNNSGDLEPGTYTVTEGDVPSGWELTDASCDNGDSPSSIDLGAGDTVTCTFTNIGSEVQASIVVTVSGTCEVTDGEGEGVIEVNISVDEGAEVVIRDGEDAVVQSFTSDGSVTVPAGATYTWEATPADGFQFPEGTETSGSITIEDCTPPPPSGWACVNGEVEFIEDASDFEGTLYDTAAEAADDPDCLEVMASIVVTVSGTCEVDGDEGQGIIDVEISVDGGADVVISDSDGDVIETLSSSGTVTVPEGATYTWEATPNEGFEFPAGSETSGSITIETCSDDPETLPFTGLDTGMMSLFASALLGGGLLLVTAMRRQEEA